MSIYEFEKITIYELGKVKKVRFNDNFSRDY
jgi:hypothetical protein